MLTPRACMYLALALVLSGCQQPAESPPPSDGEAEIKIVSDRANQICADPKYSAFYRKTACRGDQITPEQITDASTISPQAKAIFFEVRAKQDAINSEWANLLRKYGGTAGSKRASAYEASIQAQNRNNLSLYNGQITWGEYNKHRQQPDREYHSATFGTTS